MSLPFELLAVQANRCPKAEDIPNWAGIEPRVVVVREDPAKTLSDLLSAFRPARLHRSDRAASGVIDGDYHFIEGVPGY